MPDEPEESSRWRRFSRVGHISWLRKIVILVGWPRRHRALATSLATLMAVAGVTWLVARQWPTGDMPSRLLDQSDQFASIVSTILTAAGVVLAYLVWRDHPGGWRGRSDDAQQTGTRRPGASVLGIAGDLPAHRGSDDVSPAPPELAAAASSQVAVATSSRAPTTWPRLVGVVPLLADCRQPRQIDRELSDVLTAGEPNGVCLVLSGLGGVGKTQLAVARAERAWHRREVDLLVWVTGSSRASIVSSYARAAAEVTGVDDPNPEQAAGRLLGWLARTDRRWLVVVDDVWDPVDLNRLWPPATGLGQTVVTTRRRDAALAGHGRRLIEVGLFTADEAASYLHEKLRTDPGRLAGAADLVDDLGRLPLALAQAAAYILDRDLSCAGYRCRLADRKKRLTELVPEPGSLPDEHRDTIALTWSLSIDAANQLTPSGLARPVLELASLLDPNAIPTAVFSTMVALADLARCRSVDGSVEPADADDALHNLHRLSLLSFDQSSRTVRVHGLVQRVVREATSTERTTALAITAADALLETWPEIERDPAIGQLLRANVNALRQNAESALWSTATGGHPVLFRAGGSLGNAGLVTAATDYYRDLHTIADRLLGPDHPHSLIVRANIARWLGQAGNPAGAAAAFERLLPDVDRVLGADHPDTLTTRANIARWRGRAGDPAGAVTVLEELMPDRLRLQGTDHPHTLIARGNLAFWSGEAGNPVGAVAAFEKLLEDLVRVLGPDHPDTLAARGGAAFFRGRAGDAAGAAAAFEERLAHRLKVNGPDHPHTLAARGSLAFWRGEAGDPAGAAAAFQELLADRLRVLGPDHPHTLTTRYHLAVRRGEAGDRAGAAGAFEKLLADMIRVLGPDHPDTFETRIRAAYWRDQAR